MMINNLVYYLNNSKLFTGCIMLLMNVGSKYIMMDIPKSTEKIFSHYLFRRFFVFCISFIATRDIYISMVITLLFIIVFGHILNGKSKYCMLSEDYINVDVNNDGEISKQELENAQNILNKYKQR